MKKPDFSPSEIQNRVESDSTSWD